jgi:hypothetical protein
MKLSQVGREATKGFPRSSFMLFLTGIFAISTKYPKDSNSPIKDYCSLAQGLIRALLSRDR